MNEYNTIGYCPMCGCPIYQAVYWAGSGYPPAEYICKCNTTETGYYEEVTTDTTVNTNVQWSYSNAW